MSSSKMSKGSNWSLDWMENNRSSETRGARDPSSYCTGPYSLLAMHCSIPMVLGGPWLY